MLSVFIRNQIHSCYQYSLEIDVPCFRLLKYPLQCLVTTEQIIWSHRISQALKSTPVNKQAIIELK